MKRENFQSDQPIFKEDLSLAQSSKEDAIRERLTDLYQTGIVAQSQVLAEPRPFNITVNSLDPTRVDIGTGVAYSSVGERIIINDSVNYVNAYDNSSLYYSSGDPTIVNDDPNGPLTKADDGIDNFIPAPQISGSKSISTYGMVSGTPKANYIFISYLEVVDTSIFTLQKITNKRLFTTINDGYQIIVIPNNNTSDSPTAVLTAAGFTDPSLWIFIGIVNRIPTGAGSIAPGNIIFSSATGGQDLTPVFIKIDNVKAIVAAPPVYPVTSVYSPGQTVTFEEHVRAVGVGTVSPNNPHGFSAIDLGLTGKTTESHEQYFHSAGIAGDQLSTSSSFYGNVQPAAGAGYPTYGRDSFRVFGLTSSEIVHIKGTGNESKTFTSSTTNIGSLHEFFLVDNGTPCSSGNYKIVLDTVTQTIKLQGPTTTDQYLVKIGSPTGVYETRTVATLPIITPVTDFVLYSFTYFNGAGPGNFTNVADLRLFGVTGSDDLLRDSATDTVTIDHNVDITKNVTAPTIITIPPALNQPGFIVKDSATGLVNKVVLTEQGITFPDASVQDVASPLLAQSQYASAPWAGVPTASRTSGSVYQNTSTTKPLFVSTWSGYASNPSGGAYCNSFSPPTTLVAADYHTPDVNNSPVKLFFVVPPLYYYIVSFNAGIAGLVEWQ